MSAAEAAKDYLTGLQPGGEQFEYLKRLKLLHARPGEDFIAVHGGLTEGNFGTVPGDTKVYEDPVEWAKNLNQWYDKQLATFESDYKKGLKGKALPETLTHYLEAIWDPDVVNMQTGRKGMLTFNDRSVSYPYRSREGDTPSPDFSLKKKNAS